MEYQAPFRWTVGFVRELLQSEAGISLLMDRLTDGQHIAECVHEERVGDDSLIETHADGSRLIWTRGVVSAVSWLP